MSDLLNKPTFPEYLTIQYIFLPVAPATSSLGQVVGHSQATAGEPVSVAMDGSVVKIMLSADDGTADAGDWIGVSTVAGMGIVRDPAIHAHDTVVGLGMAVGYAIDDISAAVTEGDFDENRGEEE